MEIWRATKLSDLDENVDDMPDSKLMSIINMFKRRESPLPILYELEAIAVKRGINLENEYEKYDNQRDNDIPMRLEVLLDKDIADKSLSERLKTTGRTDIRELFEKSPIFTDKDMNHHPFIVFVDDGDYLNVQIVNHYSKLFAFPDETKVMVQWKGKWKSDFFRFTVKDIREYCRNLDLIPPNKNPELFDHIEWM